jgi:hypothetical protein
MIAESTRKLVGNLLRLMAARSSHYLAANERLKVRALRFSSIYSWQLELDFIHLSL